MANQYLKLNTLHIQGYKNIQDLSLDFSGKNGTTVLIGNNGCGKSNVLEAISSIFAGLYRDRLHKPDFDYAIKYETQNHDIEISLHGGDYSMKIDDKSISKTELSKNIDSYLPKNVIACYSGECQRLWDKYYWPYYSRFISEVKKTDVIPTLPMLYINRYNIEIALLTLFSYDFSVFKDIKDFCSTKLNIKSVKQIVFHYDVKKISEWNANEVLQLINHLNRVDDISTLSSDSLSLSLEEFKQRVEYLGGEREVFKILYAATMPKTDKVITEIEIKIELNNGEIIDAEALSEGEKKLLLMTTILETLADENSLLLFDEPDSYIHISRKAEMKDLFEKYPNRENIITTHSPTLAVAFDDIHIQGLGLDRNGHTIIIDSQKAKLVSEITNGMWNTQEQNLFLASTKPMTLLVEGKTDKIHIEEAFKRLKGNYPNLDFDVFYFSGADNIPLFIKGLRTSNFDLKGKKIVAVFDNDKEGRDCCNQTQLNFNGKKNKQGFYSLTLPLKNDGTIENMYDKNKYEAAYKEIVSGYSFEGLLVDIEKEITKKSKIKMSENVKSYKDSDFDGFKPLLDELLKIYNF